MGRGFSATPPRHRAGAITNTMRLIARFVVLMVAVFGVSLAFAWAWDRSDTPPATTPVRGS